VPPEIDDLIGTAGRAVAWMHYALSIEVGARRATREFAAGELERMTAIVHLLEDLRHGAAAGPGAVHGRSPDPHRAYAPQVQVSLERAKARRQA
jgi:hypothetical protein